MTPIALERITETWRSGIFILREMAARKPALPPPRTRIRWIIALPLARSRGHLPQETTADAIVGFLGNRGRADQDKRNGCQVKWQDAMGRDDLVLHSDRGSVALAGVNQ